MNDPAGLADLLKWVDYVMGVVAVAMLTGFFLSIRYRALRQAFPPVPVAIFSSFGLGVLLVNLKTAADLLGILLMPALSGMVVWWITGVSAGKSR